jgi:hypothetical protein
VPGVAKIKIEKDDNIMKNKVFMVMSSIIIIVIGSAFFIGSALAEKIRKVHTEKESILINGSIKEISAPELVVKKNRILLLSERKKRRSIEQIYRENAARQKIIQEDYMRRKQERERIKKEEEQERIKEQENKEEQEKEEEQERIKKEDWFR